MLSTAFAARRNLVHRLSVNWLILTAGAVTILLAMVLLAAGPIYAEAVTESALRRSLNEAAPAESGVVVQVGTPTSDYDTVDQLATDAINDAFAGVDVTITRILDAETLELPVRNAEVRADLAQVRWMEDIENHASLLDGSWPQSRDVDLVVEPGTLLAVRGRSGSGKTTLFNLLGELDHPTTGTVHLDGDLVSEMDEEELSEMRRSRVGFIFQAFGLIPILTAAENVEAPLRLVKADPPERRERSRVLLELVGLGDRAGHRPSELSGVDSSGWPSPVPSPTGHVSYSPTSRPDSSTL